MIGMAALAAAALAALTARKGPTTGACSCRVGPGTVGISAAPGPPWQAQGRLPTARDGGAARGLGYCMSALPTFHAPPTSSPTTR